MNAPEESSEETTAKLKFTCDNGISFLYCSIESTMPFNLNKIEQFFEYKVNFTRIAIQLNDPVLTANVKVTYT